MDREIKFRVWDIKNKNWLPISDSRLEFTDFYLTGDAKPFHLKDHFCDECGGGTNMIGIFDYKIMQYTGLKDKNSKEIYEGDVVENGADRYVVEFREGGFNLAGIEDYTHDIYIWFECVNIEVIGNIYENKDLISKEEE